MAKKNSYLQKQEVARQVYMDATADTYTQFMVDMFILALNDPEVMGKDVFGKKRIQKVVAGVQAKYDYFHNALKYGKNKREREELTPEYYQDKPDMALRQILGDEGFADFETRYDWLKKVRY